MRVRGEDRPEDVPPVGGDGTGGPRVGGRRVHRSRRVPRISESGRHRKQSATDEILKFMRAPLLPHSAGIFLIFFFL